MDRPEDNFDRNRIINLLVLLIESISFYIQSLVGRYNHIFKAFLEKFEIIQFFDAINDKLAGHPLLRVTVFTVAISCSIPVVMFIFFGIASLIITFAGFLFIEGTLLAVGGVCMFLSLTMMILVLSLLAMTAFALYVLALKVGNILNKFETSHIMRNEAPASVQASEILSLTANAHED